MLSTREKRISLTIILLAQLVMVAGCSSQIRNSPTFPVNMTVIELSDGGVCLDADSAKRLAEFRAELESW